MPNDDVLDLDALAREANETPFQFRFDGEIYTCPADVSLNMLKCIEEENILGAVQEMLGDDQWERIQAADRVFGVSAMAKVFEAYAAHLGIALPNSSVSTTSLRPTPRR